MSVIDYMMIGCVIHYMMIGCVIHYMMISCVIHYMMISRFREQQNGLSLKCSCCKELWGVSSYLLSFRTGWSSVT